MVTVSPHPPLKKYRYSLENKREFVKKLFNRGASSYNEIINLLSFGTGNFYRREALKRAGLQRGMKVLDVASGSGAVAREAARITGGYSNVVMLDISYLMLKEAKKFCKSSAVNASADSLPFENGCFDFISMGYALRHVNDLITTFTEFKRVLKKGGKLLILETTPPESKVGYILLSLYLGWIIPAISFLWWGKDAAVMMRYWWDTIKTCVSPVVIINSLKESGFTKAERSVEHSIFSEYTATF